MNIIEAVQSILNSYDKIADFSGGVQIDYTTNDTTNYGLSSTGDTLIKEDILGNQTRQHNFILYAVNQTYTDYDRLANSTFLLQLAYWLEKQQGQPVEAQIDDTVIQGEIISLSSANGMIFSVPTGDINDGITYQIQIYAQYKLILDEGW